MYSTQLLYPMSIGVFRANDLASFPRMQRLSGRINLVLDAVLAWLTQVQSYSTEHLQVRYLDCLNHTTWRATIMHSCTIVRT
jgi:hypothetical protein